jgi:hypothetical protein
MLKVYFDQNCMNARGSDQELVRIDRLAADGHFELIANPRNRLELKQGHYADLAKIRLDRLPATDEYGRWGISTWEHFTFAPFSTDGQPEIPIAKLFSAIFPLEKMRIAEAQSSLQNSLHDVMHIINAEEWGGDVFLTREKAILAARPRIVDIVRITIECPTEFLQRFKLE